MNVFVLQVSHRFGTDVWVAESDAAARAALYEYVVEYWDEAVDDSDVPIPEDHDKAIEAYFESMGERESYEIVETDLLPAGYGQLAAKS